MHSHDSYDFKSRRNILKSSMRHVVKLRNVEYINANIITLMLKGKVVPVL